MLSTRLVGRPQNMGNIKYDKEKFAELIIYVAERCESHRLFGATKMNKILFFSDFIAFRELGAPITGAQYQALERGPAPVKLLPVRKVLEKQGQIAIQRIGGQERIVPLRDPDLSGFSASEISIVESVIDELRTLSADEVSDLSHEFLGWEAAIAEGPKTPIPYETAFVSNPEIDAFDSSIVREKAREHGYV
ncbi:MAG: DUF4065 domain-containing protein [Dehalococcoidia bacterium]|nr:DUF4065 domain-containing protein [Dehalococcoidia bacterium]MYD28616.1 DUF4065 domain-containing protein [Dehalococcoidia bacterium]